MNELDRRRADRSESLLQQAFGPNSAVAQAMREGRTTLVRLQREWAPIFADLANWAERAFKQAMPPNWESLSIPEIRRARDLMIRTGWSLVWTPPGEVVKQIIDAPDAEMRRELLLGAEAQIVEDLDRLLLSVESHQLTYLRESTREALEAYRGGLFKSSQALSAALLSSLLHEQLGFKSLTEAAKVYLATDPDHAGFRKLRYDAVLRAFFKTGEAYHPVTGTPERSDFNRNATAHRVKEPQYRQVNALSALMLIVSVLVEIDSLRAAEAERERLEREAREARDRGPREEHFERVLRHGAEFVEEGDFLMAGTLYATSLISWLPHGDRRATVAQDLLTSGDEGVPVPRGAVDGLREGIAELRAERFGGATSPEPISRDRRRGLEVASAAACSSRLNRRRRLDRDDALLRGLSPPRPDPAVSPRAPLYVYLVVRAGVPFGGVLTGGRSDDP